MMEPRTSAPGLLRTLFLSGVSLAGLAVAGVFAWHHLQDTQAIAAAIDRLKPWLVVWRAALFVSLIALWPRLIDVLANHYDWDDVQRQYIATQRWRVAAWLIVIELVLVQHLIGKFVNGLMS